MKGKILSVLIFVLFLILVLSGCQENVEKSSDETNDDEQETEDQGDNQNEEEPEEEPDLTQDQIDALNAQVESLFASVEERDGFSCSISISQTEFLVGEPADSNGLDYNCAWKISMGKNPKTYEVRGFYSKENVNTFKGDTSYGEGTLGASGYCGVWKAQPVGEYYLYHGIYEATNVHETLNTNEDDVTAKEIFLNIQPEVFARVSITVSEG